MDMPLTIISIAAVIMFCRQVTVSKPVHIRICSILVQGLSNIANKCTKKKQLLVYMIIWNSFASMMLKKKIIDTSLSVYGCIFIILYYIL